MNVTDAPVKKSSLQIIWFTCDKVEIVFIPILHTKKKFKNDSMKKPVILVEYATNLLIRINSFVISLCKETAPYGG